MRTRIPPCPSADRPPATRRWRALVHTAAVVLALAGLAARAEDAVAPEEAPAAEPARQAAPTPEPEPDRLELIEDPIIRQMRALDRIAPFVDRAPLWDHRDPELERSVREALDTLGLARATRQRRLAIAFVLIEPEGPRVAAVNGDFMLYAASLPKIAVLLAAFEKIAEGRMTLDRRTEDALVRMIRDSSNRAATAMMQRVGKEYIARVLLNPRYRLYDPKRNGGLWVGKDYAEAGLWRRDPLHNLSHGATAMQVARFFYLLETGALVTPEYSERMKRVMEDPAIDHKFVRGLRRVAPGARIMRKSGTWRTYHADSVLVERGDVRYIAVALANDRKAESWLRSIIVALDGIASDATRSASTAGPAPSPLLP